MASVATLASPGVEVREYDDSLRTTTTTGTTIFIPGFAAQGPVEEINPISTMDDFENIYGQPTNAAERYFYYTVKSVLDKTGDGTTVLTSRLAYGAGDGDNVSNAFTLLAYPAVPVLKNPENTKGYDYYSVDETKIKKLVQLKKSGNGNLDATSVDTDIVLNSKVDHFNLKKIALGNSDKLPSPNEVISKDTKKPTLTWTLQSEGEGDQTTVGAVSTEIVDGDLVVHLTFALQYKDKTPFGIVKINAKYKLDVQESVNTLTFNNAEGTEKVTTTYVPAFEIGSYYSPDGVIESPEKYNDATYVLGSPVSYQISLS